MTVQARSIHTDFPAYLLESSAREVAPEIHRLPTIAASTGIAGRHSRNDRREDRRGGSSTLSDEAEKCVEDRDRGCEAE